MVFLSTLFLYNNNFQDTISLSFRKPKDAKQQL